MNDVINSLSYSINIPKELETHINIKHNNEINHINLFIDLKNCFTGLFIEDVLMKMVNINNTLSRGVNSYIFQNLVYSVCNWKYWAEKQNYTISIYISTDVGDSVYHNKINNKYKASRKIRKVLLENFKDDIDSIKLKNMELSEDVLNNFNNVFFFNFKFLESDFIPYYLLTRKLIHNDSKSLNILCGNDKDHFQFLNLDNTVMYNKMRGEYKITTKENYMKKYLKIKDDDIKTLNRFQLFIDNFDLSYIELIMSFVGDLSDGVAGIHSFGEKTAIKVLSDKNLINSVFGDSNELLERVINENKVFKNKNYNKLSKELVTIFNNEDIILKAYKQISYECLSRWMDDKDTTFKTDRIKYIKNIIKNEKLKYEPDNVNKIVSLFSNMEDNTLTNTELVKYLFK